jgi:hypothetical protein
MNYQTAKQQFAQIPSAQYFSSYAFYKHIYINKNVNVRLFKILNLRKLFTDGFANFDTMLQSNTRVFLYTYLYI